MNASRSFSLRARVVCPVGRPPIDGGVIEVADGVVVELTDRPRTDTVDLGDVAIVPGLVNCHTHLEFSNLTQPLRPARPFADWIGSVVAERRRRHGQGPAPSAERIEPDPIARGLRECFHSGSSLVGDIVTGAVEQADRPMDVLGVCREQRLVPFRELIAPRTSGMEAAWVAANAYLDETASSCPGIAVGLSPHAPYTVARDLLHDAVTRAAQDSRPLAMHLAETEEELELLASHTGPLVQLLQRIGQWAPSALCGSRPIDILKVLARAPRSLVIHGNYLTDDELEFLGRQPQMSLIYCPRTHSYFGHSRYPLEKALGLGVNVALGTDSRASNPDLNLWEEARHVAARFPEIDPAIVLRMATSNGARALGQSTRHGVIEPGRQADLCCLQLTSGERDPLRAALAPTARVVGVMHDGRWLEQPETPRA